MIVADHKKWADLIFYPYLKILLARHFYAIHLLSPIPNFDDEKPVLLLPNHSTWWDGFFIYLLNQKHFRRKIYLMMLEEQLIKNRFFRHLGTYSINPGSMVDTRQSIRYTLKLLGQTKTPTLVCFFPQGELQLWSQRPVEFKPGLEFILKSIKAKIQLCYLSIRIDHQKEQRPEVFLQLSPVKQINPVDSYPIQSLEDEFNGFLNEFERKIVQGDKGRILFQGKRSINDQIQETWKKGNSQ